MSIGLMVGRGLNWMLNLAGYECEISKCRKAPQKNEGEAESVNIGAGDWECPGWINLDYPSEWYSEAQEKHSFIPYDIRNDKLPFENGTVKQIYCSHVIEHIENQYIIDMLCECYRILNKGGVLRIACPDAEFLWQMAKCGKDYWEWRRAAYEKVSGVDFEEIRPLDCFLREVATSRVVKKNYRLGTAFQQEFDTMPMSDFLEYITDGLEFDAENVGWHINYWTYEKLARFLEKAGFKTIIRSKYLGSISSEMQDKKYFDKVHPQMSLYVEAVK